MAVHVELLNGGFLSARDPSLMDKSELVSAVNCVYRPGDPRLWRIPGWKQYDRLATASGVNGLSNTRFDNGTHYLLAQCSGKLWRGDAAATGLADTMVTAADVSTAATTLNTVQYGNRHFLFNGVDAPKVMLVDGTIREAGLSPFTYGMNVNTATGSFPGVAEGYYDYWITEVWKTTASAEMANADAPFELESAFDGTPGTIYVPESLEVRAAITLPSKRKNDTPNTQATHWRIYRGGPKDSSRDTVFPVGIQCAEDIEITEAAFGTTVYDGSPNIGGWALCTGVTATGFYASGGGAVSASLVTALGGDYMKLTATTEATADLAGFDFGTLNDPINGIEVSISCIKPDATHLGGSLEVELSFDGGGTWSPDFLFYGPMAREATGTYTRTLGSDKMKWGEYSLKQSDFTTANFRVRLKLDPGLAAAYGYYVDYVAVRVHSNGAVPPPDRIYNSIVLEAANIQGSSSAGDQPPVGEVAAVFEGMVVANTIDNPNQLRYSQPDAPEYWPVLYFLNLETDDNDTIKSLNTVNNRLVVGQTGGIIRVNYLPIETDADFHRGIAWEVVSRTHGVVNHRCATVFTGPDGRQLMAFISHNGLYATDGYSIINMSDNIDWFKTIAVGSEDPTTSLQALVADPSTHTLWIYKNNGVAYVYHYLTKVWTGPNYIAPSGVTISDALCVRGPWNKHVHYIGIKTGTGSIGKIMVSDTSDYAAGMSTTSLSMPHTGHTNMIVKTRDMYLAGLGHEYQANSLAVYGDGDYSNIDGTNQPLPISATMEMRYTNDADVTGQVLDVVPPLGNMTMIPLTDANAAAMAFSVTAYPVDPVTTAYFTGYCGPERLQLLILDINPGEEATDA